MIILIDSGTTNSRIRLVEEHEVTIIASVKIEVGVRNTAIDGHNEKLKQELAQGVQRLLEEQSLSARDISYIVAAGMITSNLGLHEVPHITAPARLEDFIKGVQVLKTEEFLNIPCLYIPGMKNAVADSLEEDLSVINQYDVMRGEEVETYGLLKQISTKGKGLMVLPGSHTKYVLIGEKEELLSCRSTLGGEMLKAVRDQTIISDSLSKTLVEEVVPEYLIKGFLAAQKTGVTRCLYHIRLLQLFSELNANERANYYAGAILYYDVEALEQMVEIEQVEWIMIGGSEPLRSLFYHLLTYVYDTTEILTAAEEQAEMASVYGAAEIGRMYQSIKEERST
ncbi:2-dehydro-3-deoxygalactonokinase [Pseudalkalibacillus hwajinpoensis]|uniref:2-dehydro-3-deoxygalactonokinase n=1 Tax=Guptibacillus hwajinpoensis TaxID=208199 RepID=UPI00325A84A1